MCLTSEFFEYRDQELQNYAEQGYIPLDYLKRKYRFEDESLQEAGLFQGKTGIISTADLYKHELTEKGRKYLLFKKTPQIFLLKKKVSETSLMELLGYRTPDVINLSRESIDRSLERVGTGLGKYLAIMDAFWRVDVCRSRDFQKSFNGFYRVRRNKEWQSHFYSLMQDAKTSPISFEEAFDELYELTGRYEASFASKLVATLDSESPVIDKFVLEILGARLPYPYEENRRDKIISIYHRLVVALKAFLRTDNGMYLVKEFDSLFPDAGISDIKKVDFVLWQIRDEGDERNAQESPHADLWTLLDKDMRQPFKGWDFKYLIGHNRMVEAPLPWNYESLIHKRLPVASSLLDMGTGGGEFLSSLKGLPDDTHATEGYPPNLEIAKKRLVRQGIRVHNIQDNHLPFEDDRFDLIINRHEEYRSEEVKRVIQPGGLFITQQVGGLNDADLNTALGAPLPEFSDWCLAKAVLELEEQGLDILKRDECITNTRFYDIGAVVYYLKCIPWQIEGFKILDYLGRLKIMAERIEEKGYIDFICHRFVVTAMAKG